MIGHGPQDFCATERIGQTLASMTKASSLALSLLLASAVGCSKDNEESAPAPAKAAEAEAPTKAAAVPKAASVPTETEVIALDQGESKVPATIEAPKGATTFNDTPTTIRVTFKDGADFWVDVKKGNEFNLDLDQTEKDLLENKYGVTSETIEKSKDLYVWKSTVDGHSSQKFKMIVDLAGEKWVCTTGNYGGYEDPQIRRMIEACKTVKAK